MKPIHILTVLLLLTCLLAGVTWAQHYSVLVQGGISSYHLVGGFSRGVGDDRWKSGPLLGLGLRWTASRWFSVAATVEYSTHAVENPLEGLWTVTGKPTNTIWDINLVARWHIWRLARLYGFLPFGIGYWHQTVDAVETNSPFSWRPPGFTASGLGGLFGLGLGVELARDLELTLEGTLRLRKYTTPAAQLGVAYRLD